MRVFVCAALLALLLVVLGSGVALAHTSLLTSSPSDQETLAESPRRVRLEFSRPVDPRAVSARVLASDGTPAARAARRAASSGSTSVVEFDLDQQLGPGTYGVVWTSLGDDAHRVTGEIVFRIGRDQDEGLASPLTPVGGGSSWLSRAEAVGGAAGRLVFVLGTVLVLGGLFAASWAGRHDLPSDHPLALTARNTVRIGFGAAVAGAAGRLLATAVVVTESYADAQLGVLAARPVRLLLVSLLLALLGWALSRRRVWLAAAVLVASAGSAAATGHLGGVVGGTVGAAHTVAAGLWLGPLAVLLGAMATKAWRAAPPAERRALAQRYLRAYGPVAGWSLAVLVASGLAIAVRVAGPDIASRYAALLVVKAAIVVAVVAPLGWFHHRALRADTSRAARVVEGRTLRFEAAALVAVVVLGVVLTGIAPSRPATSALAAEGFPGDDVSDSAECEDLAVGRSSCYRTYFASLMRSDGVDAAVAAIEAAAAEPGHVQANCHQVLHDLGRDAAADLGFAEALAVDGAYACASGYYHGVVEATLVDYDDDQLAAELPDLCGAAPGDRYGLAHYNCVHGAGHGVMLRFHADLWAAVPLCEVYTDEWERQSCLSGAFMENVVTVQEGHGPGTFDNDDALYPCSALRDRAAETACFGIHTGYLLWRLGGDLSAAFAVCETAKSHLVGDCYQSMGRDISGTALLDPGTVIVQCALGDERWRSRCYVGAALNAVYSERDTTSATRLCEALHQRYREDCSEARDDLAARL